MTELIQNSYQEKPPINKSLLDIFVSDTNTKYIDGTPIEKAAIEVIHGSELASNKSWVSLNLKLNNDKEVPGGGYKLKDGEFYLFSGEKANNPDSMIGPIFNKLENHFKENPKDLEKITIELNK